MLILFQVRIISLFQHLHIDSEDDFGVVYLHIVFVQFPSSNHPKSIVLGLPNPYCDYIHYLLNLMFLK